MAFGIYVVNNSFLEDFKKSKLLKNGFQSATFGKFRLLLNLKTAAYKRQECNKACPKSMIMPHAVLRHLHHDFLKAA